MTQIQRSFYEATWLLDKIDENLGLVDGLRTCNAPFKKGGHYRLSRKARPFYQVSLTKNQFSPQFNGTLVRRNVKNSMNVLYYCTLRVITPKECKTRSKDVYCDQA